MAAIRSAASGLGEDYELVVADDGSTDSTPDIARAGGAQLVQITRRQIAAARNAGARVARGEVLFFVDADTRISAEHVAEALEVLGAGHAGGSARVLVQGAVPLWGRLFLRVFSTLYFATNLGAGAFLFTTRENFKKVGGFDEQLFVAEEVYFSIALKKIGRFKLLSVPVVTSGRKLRMYSAGKVLSRMIWMIVRGPAAARNRDNCGIWYDGRRENAAVE